MLPSYVAYVTYVTYVTYVSAGALSFVCAAHIRRIRYTRYTRYICYTQGLSASSVLLSSEDDRTGEKVQATLQALALLLPPTTST